MLCPQTHSCTTAPSVSPGKPCRPRHGPAGFDGDKLHERIFRLRMSYLNEIVSDAKPVSSLSTVQRWRCRSANGDGEAETSPSDPKGRYRGSAVLSNEPHGSSSSHRMKRSSSLATFAGFRNLERRFRLMSRKPNSKRQNSVCNKYLPSRFGKSHLLLERARNTNWRRVDWQARITHSTSTHYESLISVLNTTPRRHQVFRHQRT